MSRFPRRRRGDDDPAATTSHRPSVPVAGYEILAEIGRGASGRVYRATQARLGREVALKVLDVPPDDRDARRRFDRELSITVRLGSHPHIAQVLDAGQAADGRPYLAMELFERGSAGDWLARYGPFSSTDAVRAGVAIADALAAAHGAGVLHRDVKPENILLSEYGPALTDFGIARPTDQLDRTSSFSQFTPWHAAPEVLLDGSPTEAADVYSLASTIFTLVDGRPPFAGPPGETLLAFQRRVLTEDHRRVPATVEPTLGEVILAGLVRDPDQRIATAAELRDRLRAATGTSGGAGPLGSPSSDGASADDRPIGAPGDGAALDGGVGGEGPPGDADRDRDAGDEAGGGVSGVPSSATLPPAGADAPGPGTTPPPPGGPPPPDLPVGADTLPPGSGPLDRGPDLAATAPRRRPADDGPAPPDDALPPPPPPPPATGTGPDRGDHRSPPAGPLGDRGDLSLTRAAGTAPDPQRPALDDGGGAGRARWPWVIAGSVALAVILLVAWFAWFRPDDPAPPPPPDPTPPTVSVAPPAAPGTPTDVEVEELDPTTVELTWTDTTGGAGTTAVLVVPEGGDTSVVQVDPGAERQVVGDLEPVIGYCFQVRVFAAPAESPDVLDFRADPVCIRGAVPAQPGDPTTTTTTGG